MVAVPQSELVRSTRAYRRTAAGHVRDRGALRALAPTRDDDCRVDRPGDNALAAVFGGLVALRLVGRPERRSTRSARSAPDAIHHTPGPSHAGPQLTSV